MLREWEKISARVSSLRVQVEDHRAQSVSVERILAALGDGDKSGDPLNLFAVRLKADYSDSAISRLGDHYSQKLCSLSELGARLRDESISVFDAVTAFSDNPGAAHVITSGQSMENFRGNASALEILEALQAHGEAFIRAVQHEKRKKQKESQLESRVLEFRDKSSPQLKTILDLVDRNCVVPQRDEMEMILSGSPLNCLDPAPSPEVLGVLSQYPETAQAALDEAGRLIDEMVAEYGELLCVPPGEIRGIKSVPDRARVDQIRSLREQFPEELWTEVMGRISVETRNTESVSSLQGYVAASARLHEFSSRAILLPWRYRTIPAVELLRAGTEHPDLADLDSVIPGFALRLPHEVHEGLCNVRGRLRSLASSHPDLSLSRIQKELLADIVVFGFFRFGNSYPYYSFGDLYRTVRERGVYSGDFGQFAEFFERKLLPLKNFIFIRSCDRGVQRSTLIQFSPNKDLDGWGDRPFDGIMETLRQSACVEGNETARRIVVGNGLTFLLDDVITIPKVLRNFFGVILNGSDVSKLDIRRAAAVASDSANTGFLFKPEICSDEMILLGALSNFVRSFWSAEKLGDVVNMQEWAHSMGLGHHVDMAVAEMGTLREMLESSRLYSFFDSTRRAVDLESWWVGALDCVEDFAGRWGDHLDELLEGAEHAAAEVRAWREENDS